MGSESSAPSERNSEMEIGTVRERLRDHYCSRTCQNRADRGASSAERRLPYAPPYKDGNLDTKVSVLFFLFLQNTKTANVPGNMNDSGKSPSPPSRDGFPLKNCTDKMHPLSPVGA